MSFFFGKLRGGESPVHSFAPGTSARPKKRPKKLSSFSREQSNHYDERARTHARKKEPRRRTTNNTPQHVIRLGSRHVRPSASHRGVR